MNGASFLAYVEQILAPTLRRGDIVIMDNVSVHKVAGIREVIEARGAALCYLPAYSPDLNHDPWRAYGPKPLSTGTVRTASACGKLALAVERDGVGGLPCLLE
jgi:hypothetical protein